MDIYTIVKDVFNAIRYKEEDKIVSLTYPEDLDFRSQMEKQGYDIETFCWPWEVKTKNKRKEGFSIVYEFDKWKRRRYRLIVKNPRYNQALMAKRIKKTIIGVLMEKLKISLK